MLTLDNLRSFGADVNDGLMRCMNNEGFYLMLVGKALNDKRLYTLQDQILAGDYDAAFEIAHALKGLYANLSLTPLTNPVSRITELLRSRTVTDYSGLLGEAISQYEKLTAI